MADSKQIPTHFDNAEAAATYYPAWERAGYFRGDPDSRKRPYAIAMPPPNVTGSLHMGHALNNTLQDILARYRRMAGDNVVWVPGVDHASIAVHWVVERVLKKEGTSREKIGREAFLKRAWALKEEIAQTITSQQRQLGISCDWERASFTMDAPRSRAVREAFVRLYADGLIYRAERLVNWDPVTQTTLSDLEVIFEDNTKGELIHFAYPLADGSGRELVVATTRPETLMGDTAVAVHPEDPRYKDLIGQNLRHPYTGETLPVVGDSILVDREFGSGCVKITPAHDFNDFEVGKRHKLAVINILHPDGTLNERAKQWSGLSVSDARVAIIEQLETDGLLRGREPHRNKVGRSERSGAIVEPRLSTQWYVRARPLARPALAAIEQGATQFVPRAWENTYFSWLREIRDWCISRQLWWGHRIPAWHCAACAHITVAAEDPSACAACDSKAIRQDDDILDTWFSSALWPFSIQGWPDKSQALATWYPTAVVVTSFDIIFFWIARMMMFGQYLMGEVPFRDVYIHALIRDASGEKMSKTKGNVVNPIAMIERYGLDAFRFTLTAFAGQGRDVRWDEARAQGYQKFINKIWQAFRFSQNHAPKNRTGAMPKRLGAWEKWLLGRLGEATRQVREALDAYRFNDAASAIYHVVWNDLCDWYIESTKTKLYDENAHPDVQEGVRHTLEQAFECIARLMHPIMPFLSASLWEHLPSTEGSIMQQVYPVVTDFAFNMAADAEVAMTAEVVTSIRRLRAEYGVKVKDEIEVQVAGPSAERATLFTQADCVRAMAKTKLAPLDPENKKNQVVVTEMVGELTLYLSLSGLIDFAQERKRLEKETLRLDADIRRVEGQLSRPDFIARAPAEVVEEKKALAAAYAAQKQRLGLACDRLSQSS